MSSELKHSKNNKKRCYVMINSDNKQVQKVCLDYFVNRYGQL